MLQTIEWIFFDLGSTLIDETKADARRIREMIAGTNISKEAYCKKRFEMIRRGLPGDEAAIAYFQLKKAPWHSEEEVPYPDAAPTLNELKRRGYRLGVIANQNPGTEQRLAGWNLITCFSQIVASAETGVAKPDPAIFRYALQQAHCSAQNAAIASWPNAIAESMSSSLISFAPASSIEMKVAEPASSRSRSELSRSS